MIPAAVPFFSLQKQTETLRQELLSGITQVVDSQQFINGPFVEACEQKLAHSTGAQHCIGLNSGTDALLIALKAVNIQKNDIVLTTPFSFIASSSEIAHHEAHPVFIDIDKRSYNIDSEKILRWLETETTIIHHKVIHTKTGYPVVGILTVDLFGQLADYPAIKKIAEKYKLWIIEDACQAIGATLNEKQAGTFGDIGTFSFYPTKNLGAFGDAGCCLTDNLELAQAIMKQRNHGRLSHYVYEELGVNSRLDALQAAVITAKLPHLKTFNARRQAIAAYYKEKLAQLPGIILPETVIGEHSYHQFTVWTAERDRLISYLESKQIGTRIFYPQALNTISFLQTDPRLATATPIAHQASESVLSLPIYPELTDAQVEYVTEQLLKASFLVSPAPLAAQQQPIL